MANVVVLYDSGQVGAAPTVSVPSGGSLVPSPPPDAAKFLNGAASPAFAAVKDSDLSTSDVATNNVSTSKHGFAPKAPNDATKFLRGDATWAVPPASDVGQEKSYVEFIADASITATTEGTANTVVTAAAFTADGTSAYLVEFYSPASRPAAATNALLRLWLYEDGASIGQASTINSQAANNATQPINASRRLVPAAGSRTYSIRASVSTGTGIVGAGAGGSGNVIPGFIRITKVT